jgi:hypothetical protein
MIMHMDAWPQLGWLYVAWVVLSAVALVAVLAMMERDAHHHSGLRF